MKKEKITHYRFESEVKKFLDKLNKKPITAKVTKVFLDNDITKDKLIKALIKKNIIERHESIKDSSNSEYDKPTYCVKYKVFYKDFNDRIDSLYKELIDENKSVFKDEDKMREKLYEKEPKYKECGGIGCALDEDNDMAIPVISRPAPTTVMERKIYLTKKQFDYIQENINTNTLGDTEVLKEEGEGATNCAGVGITGSGDLVKGSFLTPINKKDEENYTKIKIKQVMK